MSKIKDFTELKAWLGNRLPEKRYLHTLSVADVALSLAKRFSLDENDVLRSALYHDAYRYIEHDKAIKELRARGFFIYKEEEENEKLIHAPYAAMKMADDLEEAPSVCVTAVRFHTLGSVLMGKIGAAVYIADYAEPRRKHLTDEDREKIFSLPTLEDMVKYIIEEQNAYFKEKGIKNAEVTNELYSFLTRGGRFED